MWKQKHFLYYQDTKDTWNKELFKSKLYPPNTTVEWIDTDKPENAVNNKQINYTFNEYGFRSDSFEDRGDINILVCGCSHTVGVGVDQNDNWANVLKQKLQKATDKKIVVWNLATSGASCDYVVRTVYKTLDILQPDYVCVLWPPRERLELPSLGKPRDGCTIQTHVHDIKFPKLLVDQEWLDDYNFAKNNIMLDTIGNTKNCRVIKDSDHRSGNRNLDGEFFPANSEARDGLHPNEDWHNTVAEYYFSKIINTTAY